MWMNYQGNIGLINKHIERNGGLYLTILLFIFHGATGYVIMHYDKMVYFNNFIKFYEFIAPIELGVLISFIIQSIYYKKTIIFASILWVLPVFLAPIFLVFLPFLLVMVAALISLGIGLGTAIEKITSNFNKIALLVIISFFILINISITLYVANKAFHCEIIDDEEERNDCYRSKAMRSNDVNICEYVSDDNLESRKYCYKDVLFDLEHENAKTVEQCNGILNEKSKNYCYAYIAEANLNEEICHRISDASISKYCMIHLQTNRCRKIYGPKKKAECEALIPK